MEDADSDFKTYYQTTVLLYYNGIGEKKETSVKWSRGYGNRPVHTQSIDLFLKVQRQLNGERIVYALNDLRTIVIHMLNEWMSECEGKWIGKWVNFNPYLVLYTKINSKRLIDVNLKHQTINLEENIGEKSAILN